MNFKWAKYAVTVFVASGSYLQGATAEVVIPDGFFLAQLSSYTGVPGESANPRHFQNGDVAPVDNTLTYNTAATSGRIDSVVSTQPGFRADVSTNGLGAQMIASGFGGYYFAITAATDTIAHILIAGSGAVSAATNSQNSASLYFSGTPSGATLIGQACASSVTSCAGVADSFSFSSPFEIQTNTVYNLQFHLDVVASSLNGGSDHQFGYVDPIISFDPAFGSGNGFPKRESWQHARRPRAIHMGHDDPRLRRRRLHDLPSPQAAHRA